MVKSMTWARMAPALCKGPATQRWQQTGTDRADRATKASQLQDQQQCTARMFLKHNLVVSYPVFWCMRCGGCTESATKLLNEGCRVKPRGESTTRGVGYSLKMLMQGEHPNTKVGIPKSIQLSVWTVQQEEHRRQQLEIQQQRAAEREQASNRAPPCINDDGTELTRAFLTRGCGKQQYVPKESAIHRMRRTFPEQRQEAKRG